MKNVLVFPCGSEIGLEIHNALKYSKDFNLFGGSSVDDHGKYVYKNYIPNIPFIDDDNLLDYLNNIIDEFNIDLIYPAHDDVVLKLSEIKDELNAHIVVSDDETCDVCRSKSKTYQFFKDQFFTPKVYDVKREYFENEAGIESVKKITNNEFPIFLKPDIGQGAKGVAIAYSIDDLYHYFNENPNLVAVEYLTNEEYTIDCFTLNGELLYCEKRERIRVKDGISVNATTVVTEKIVKDIAEIINSSLSFNGAWFFQLKKDKNNEYKLLEIAPRIAGTMALHRNSGINFPLLTLYAHLGINVSIISNDENLTIDRALTNRFNYEIDYKRVYLDFDDTVIVKGKINTYLMMFLYQCVNNGIEIILITKHLKDIGETLKRYKIDKNLFSDIIQLSKDDEKYMFMDDKVPSIFVDDSFSERLKIYDKLKFPVFDLDAIESLIDWRM